VPQSFSKERTSRIGTTALIQSIAAIQLNRRKPILEYEALPLERSFSLKISSYVMKEKDNELSHAQRQEQFPDPGLWENHNG
jgi:hypothetical protein